MNCSNLQLMELKYREVFKTCPKSHRWQNSTLRILFINGLTPECVLALKELLLTALNH